MDVQQLGRAFQNEAQAKDLAMDFEGDFVAERDQKGMVTGGRQSRQAHALP